MGMRLFRSSEDFTRDIVQIEILHRDGVYYKREFRRMCSCGKYFKAKGAWALTGWDDERFKKFVSAYRNDKVYKIYFDKRFLYSAKITKEIGPR